MTSSAVKGVHSLPGYAQTKKTGNSQNELMENFTDAFSKASGKQNFAMQNDNAVQGTTKVQVNHSDKKGLDNSQKAQTSTNAEKTQEVKPDKEVQDEMQKAGEELVKEVAEELGVSEEEVKNAMELLGLTMADLLNADNMTQLVLTLEGADQLSLMTDEGLYNSLQNLLGKVNNSLEQLQKDLGLSAEELAAIMEQMKSDADQMVDEQPENLLPEEEVQKPDGAEDYAVTVERDGEVVKVSVEVDGNSKTESAEVTSTKVQAPEEMMAKPAAKEEGSKNQHSSQGEHTQSNLLLEGLLNKNQPVQTEAVFENPMAGNTASTQDIMNQIMDYMKVQIKTDLTQMELQLHPASLGSVHINLTSKEGVITAQFLTQNETVKAAIESQIVQLKNNFEEQGLKVEAVEVTVESHAFERNLSGEGNGQQQSQSGKKKNARKINLNELNLEEETQMDDAEQIAVAMMSAEGNTVDYTA